MIDKRSSVVSAAQSARRKRFLYAALFGLCTVLAATYIAGSIYFSSHFLPNTKIGEADVSYGNTEYAASVLRNRCSASTITVVFRQGRAETMRGADLNLSVSGLNEMVERQLSIQKESPLWKWPAAFFTERNFSPAMRYDFNGTRFFSHVRNFPEMQKENMAPPENARIEKADDSHSFKIIKEKEGNTVNTIPAIIYIANAIRNGKNRIILDGVQGIYAEPDVSSDSARLKEKLEELNTAVSGGISYAMPDGSVLALGPDTVSEWVSQDETGDYFVDEDAWRENAEEFVDELAAECNSVWEEREFDSTEYGTITIPGGTYGYILDKDAEIEEIMDRLSSAEAEHVERKPYYTQEESEDRSNHGIGGTYVEVSISDQHLWYYEDGEIVLETPVVTGTRGRSDTPRGQFRIQYTQRNAVLVGRPDANGEPSYRTPVSWWMPFYNGCGLHDAGWRGSFGGSIYTYGGSHGCVNMPPVKAEQLFFRIEGTDTIVVVY